MKNEGEIDTEKLKIAVETAKKLDIVSLMRAVVEMLKAYSDMAKRIGIIQRDNKEAFEALTYLGSMAPQIVKALAKKAPPEEFGAFIQAFMDLLELSPKLDKIMELPAEEKIEIGERLEKIANTLEEIISKVSEEKKTGE